MSRDRASETLTPIAEQGRGRASSGTGRGSSTGPPGGARPSTEVPEPTQKDLQALRDKIQGAVGAVGIPVLMFCEDCGGIILEGHKLPNGMQVGGAKHIADAAVNYARLHPGAIETMVKAVDRVGLLQLGVALSATVVPVFLHHSPFRRTYIEDPVDEDTVTESAEEAIAADFRPTVPRQAADKRKEGGPLPGQLS